MAVSLRLGEGLRRALIPVIDRAAPLRGRLAQAGGVLPLGRFPEAEIDCYLHKLSTRGRYRLTRAEIRELLPKFSQYGVRPLLNDYLGPWWSADYAAVWRSPRQSISGEWHHDNVGNRVKLFVVLATSRTKRNGVRAAHPQDTLALVYRGQRHRIAAAGSCPAARRCSDLRYERRTPRTLFGERKNHFAD